MTVLASRFEGLDWGEGTSSVSLPKKNDRFGRIAEEMGFAKVGQEVVVRYFGKRAVTPLNDYGKDTWFGTVTEVVELGFWVRLSGAARPRRFPQESVVDVIGKVCL